MKKVVILGSTGSIGTQAIEVIQNHPEKFEIFALTARRNSSLLINQAIQFKPKYVVIDDNNEFKTVCDALSSMPVKVLSGSSALSEIVCLPEVDIVLTAMVGFSGLSPTLAAVSCGKNIALANKETLVVAGALITSLAAKTGSGIYPVDSEHSAIFQCLAGEKPSSVEKLILTASGGPFRGMTEQQLREVTSCEALKHPNWCMGNKVTIDSASMMNKGLEVIEARWLFNISVDDIEVVIHPQSIIHSLVRFIDGSIKAQMGLPDMRLPIQYALSYPERINSDFPRFEFSNCRELTFEEPNLKLFRNLSIAYNALRSGGNMPCIMNAANEIAVEAFLNDKIRFTDMPVLIEDTMAKVTFIKNPDLNDLQATDREARIIAKDMSERLSV